MTSIRPTTPELRARKCLPFVATLAIGLFVAGCSTGAQPTPASPVRIASDYEQLERLARERSRIRQPESYEIGPNDLLEINVFDLPELTRTVRVSGSGFIQLPLIGGVDARGQTEAELANAIATRLERNHLTNPQVDVFVAEYKSQQVAVTGAVAEPGVYPLTRDANTLLDLVSQAGGLTREAGPIIEFVPVSRSSSGAVDVASLGTGDVNPAARESIKIALNELLRGGSQTALNLPVISGDVIHVTEAGEFTIEGWVEKPGTYPLSRNTTILAAISTGGGPAFPAKLNKVQILRKSDERQARRQSMVVDVSAIRDGKARDVALQPGDVIRVPPYATLLPAWAVYGLFRSIIRIGASVPIV